MYHLVYLTRNLINNKIYVGVHSTYDLDDGYLGTGNNIRRAIKKYGKENFKNTILYYCYDAEQMYLTESQIVNESFIKRKDTYNISTGGRGCNKGQSFSDEHKQKISKSNMGKTFSEETKKKLSDSHKKQCNRKGSHHSIETKYKMSELKKNMSTETKKKISESMKGKPSHNKGKFLSNEQKQKISISLKKYHSSKKPSEEQFNSNVQPKDLNIFLNGFIKAFSNCNG